MRLHAESKRETLNSDHPVIDAYSKWAGVCEPAVPLLKKLKQEFAEEVHFVQVDSALF